MNQKNKKGDWYDVQRIQLEKLREGAHAGVEFIDRILDEMDKKSLVEIRCQNWSKATASIEAYNRALGAILTGLIRTISEPSRAKTVTYGEQEAAPLKVAEKKRQGNSSPKKPE